MAKHNMTVPYNRQPEDPARQAVNSDEQKRQRDEYRHKVAAKAKRNTGLSGFEKSIGRKHNCDYGHKNSQDPAMLSKDDQELDCDNNMRKDADKNLDQR